MRPRRLIVISLVGLLVVAAAGYAGERVLAGRQQDAYAVGHAAYLRGDCARALPALEKARVGGLDDQVAARADLDRKPCQQFESVRAKAARLKPAPAVISYLVYLGSDPVGPLAAAARAQARRLLTSAPLTKIVTAGLCRQELELGNYKVLSVDRKDPLAAPFLAACGPLEEKDDPYAAFRTYSRLQADFPKSPQARSTIPGLGRAAIKTALPLTGKEWPEAEPYRADRSLNGKTRLVLQNNGPAALSMVVVGPTTRLVGASACKKCAYRSARQASPPCPGRGPVSTVILPAGRYSIVRLDGAEGGLGVGKWQLKAGQEYYYCFDDYRDDSELA